MMTPLQRSEIRRYLEDFNFSALFTDSTVGWDWPVQSGKLRVPHQGSFVELETVAEKRGVKVLLVPADASGDIISSDDRKKLEKAVTPLATEHLLIFTDARKSRQVWLWTSRWPGKPISYRELIWEKGKANELLLQKLSSIAFTLDEEDALDITGVVLRLRDSLDRDKVTKRFYEQFKTQKDGFRKFIKGITDGGLLDWYTSLMLNRLMFCYFLQRKGFLDGDHDYLTNRLERVREEFGKEKFHSFYKSFLRRLFHEGLGQPKNERNDELRKLIGDVPYLNGGTFEEHKIEREHPGLHIPDEAFEKVFAFSMITIGISMTDPSRVAKRLIPKSLATCLRNTPTKRRWALTTQRRTSPITLRRTALFRSCSTLRATSSPRLPGISYGKIPTATSIPPSVTASSATIRQIRNSTRLCRCPITSRAASTLRHPISASAARAGTSRPLPS
jgi:hypothetical protein